MGGTQPRGMSCVTVKAITNAVHVFSKQVALEECKGEECAVASAAQESVLPSVAFNTEDLHLSSGTHPSPAFPATPNNTPFGKAQK